MAVSCTVAALAVACGVYYSLKVAANADYLTSRNFRVLEIISQRIEDHAQTLQQLLETEADKAIANAAEGKKTEKDIHDALEAELKKRTDVFLDVQFSCDVETPSSESPRLPVGSSIPGSAWKLEITHERVTNDLKIVITARAGLDEIVEPFLLSGIFKSVLLLDEKQQVLSDHGPARLRISRLELPATDTEKKTEPSKSKEDVTSGHADEADAGPPGVSVRAREVFDLRMAGDRHKAFYQPLRLFVPDGRPLGARMPAAICGIVDANRFRSDSLALNPLWVLGLTVLLFVAALSWPFLKILSMGPREQIGTRDVALLAFSLLVGVALTTEIGLGLVSYQSPDQTPDHASSVANARSLGQQSDRQLRQLSEGLKNSLEAEIRAALNLLIATSHRALADLDSLPESRDGDQATSLRFGGEMDCASVRKAYPFFEAVFWADKSGWQRLKWATRIKQTPLNKVGDREYFVHAIENRLWTLKPVDVSAPPPPSFYLEPVRSRTTGELSAILAAPLDDLTGTHGRKSDWVAAISTSLLSVMRAILPTGFGFAIVDEDGKTLFHSSQERSLAENFVEECDNNGTLRSALFSRTPHWLTAKYWGKDHRLFVRPLEGVPWSLVVFQERELLRTLHMEMIALSLYLFMLLLAGYAVLFLMTQFMAPGAGLKWLLPDRSSAEEYLRLALFLLIVALELLRGMTAYPGRVLLLACFTLPLGGFCAGVFILCQANDSFRRLRIASGLAAASCFLLLLTLPHLSMLGAGEAQVDVWKVSLPQVVVLAVCGLVGLPRGWPFGPWAERRLTRRAAYVACGVAALVVLAAIPSYGFFKLSWQEEVDLLVRHNQIQTIRRLDAAHDVYLRESSLYTRLEDWICSAESTFGYRNVFTDAFYETRPRSSNITFKRFACPSEKGKPTRSTVGQDTPALPEVLRDWIPLYNDLSVQLRHLDGPGAFDRRWQWISEGSLRLEQLDPNGDVRESIDSAPPLFSLGKTASLWAGVLLAIPALCVLLRFLGHRLFLLEFAEPETVPIQSLARLETRHRLFVVCPPHCREEVFLRRLESGPGDVPGAGQDPANLAKPSPSAIAQNTLWTPRFRQFPPETAEEGSWLQEIEAALQEPHRPVVILSAAEPEAAEPESAPSPEALSVTTSKNARRWHQLLSKFLIVVADDPGNPDQFKKALDAARQRSEASSRRSRAHVEQLLKTVERECAGHGRLQGIGEALLERPDFPEYDTERLIRHIRELADGYYASLWNSLSKEEQALLAHLAQGSLVNPKSGRALSRLMARRLIVRDPYFRLMGRSFERFVVSTAKPEEIAAWERTGAISLWRQIRIPLLISLTFLTGFLLYTQRQALPTVMAGLTALATIIPTLLKLLEELRPAARTGKTG